ncbi:MAG: PEP-CTERM sorting domain-containing protein [Patescibacteria group bacterium]|nr:PEP-CTERM sorting domain-containing protein [Patescibacteria group bacterium]
MIRLRVCIVLAVVCSVSVAGAVAGLIENGNFESVTGGKFDSWNYTPDKAVANVSTAPAVIGGTYSARLIAGTASGGVLEQTVSTVGLSHFTIDFDFAVLPGNNGQRTLGILSNGDAANVAVYYTASGAELRFYTGSAWLPTGLFVDTTSNWTETPAINHLTLEGMGYGTPDASLTLTLTGGVTNGTYTNTSNASKTTKLSTFGFFGHYRDTAFLVDNVSVVPEPSTFVLLSMAALGLLTCTRRKRA